MNRKAVSVVAPLALSGAIGFLPAIPAAATDALPGELRRCAAIVDGTARLACYDALAGAPGSTAGIPTTQPAAPAPSPTRTTSPSTAVAEANSTPQSSGNADFGIRGGPLQKHEPTGEKRMLAAVSRVSTLPRGEVMVTLDNGQMWVQLESTNFPIQAGDRIEIERGSLGSYILWSPSARRSAKVTRIN